MMIRVRTVMRTIIVESSASRIRDDDDHDDNDDKGEDCDDSYHRSILCMRNTHQQS